MRGSVLGWLAAGLLVVSMPLRAQTPPARAGAAAPGVIGGVVVSAGEGSPVVAAAVTIRSAADSAVVAGGLTSPAGRFRVEGLPFGRYLIRISHLSYTPHALEVVELTPAAAVVDMGRIELEPAPVELEAVAVEAQRAGVILEADRTVYDTRDTPASAGTATDVLRSVPELEVDANGRVTLRGNQSVAIHLNGRPAPMRGEALTTFLQQLPGNRIAKVEVMPNPSARHDPEGMGGIVNIVLRDDVELGISGSASLNTSTRLTHGGGGRLNFQRGRLTLFTGGSLSWSSNETRAYDVRENLLATPITLLEQVSAAEHERRFGALDGTAELRVGRQATVWTSFWGYGSTGTSLTLAEYGLFDTTRTPLERYDRDTDGRSGFDSGQVTIGFKQVFQPQRHDLTVDARRSENGNDSYSRLLRVDHPLADEVADLPAALTLTDFDQRTREHSLQADYNRPWRARGRVSTGVRVAERRFGDDNVMQLFATAEPTDPLEATRTSYDHVERFGSAYVTLNETFGRWGVQLGVRGELAATEFRLPLSEERFASDYQSVFPSLNVSYDLQRGRSARFSYSKRISRPWPGLLNPHTPAPDPLNRNVGNPDLKPTYTHSFSLDLSWIGTRGTLRMAPYYRHTVDGWDRIRSVDEAGVSTLTWANVATIQSYGSSLTFSLRPTGRLSGAATLNGFQEKRDARNIAPELARTSLRWSANGNANLTVHRTLTLTANGFYMPAQQMVQGSATGMFMSSLGLRQQVWGTKGTVQLSVNDPFNLYTYRFTTSDRTHVQSSRTNMRMRQAMVRLTYNFGKPPQQQSRRQAPEEEGAPTSIIR